MSKTRTILTLILLYPLLAFNQDNSDSIDNISLLFIGDIMGHGTQIKSAYNDSTKKYNFDKVFKFIKNEMSEADLTIANLEVTFAGKPYRGYPQFSSPDELAIACKNAGINCVVTANNHSCDRGKRGVVRTLDILDSLNILHTGTFKNKDERDNKYPLIIEKNNIKIAILNYTNGTNGFEIPTSTVVNLINTSTIDKDIETAKSKNVDMIIMIAHWGKEYGTVPNDQQTKLTKHCFSKGVDIIIGSHPHVLQKMMWHKKTDTDKDKLIAYSLGNFVSNQRKRKTDGGAMVKINISKMNNKSFINSAGYYLTWVYKHDNNFDILPCSKYENEKEFFKDSSYYKKMKLFIDDSRNLFKNQNLNMKEYIYSGEEWKLGIPIEIMKQTELD